MSGAPAAAARTRVDHLVVAAASLDEGIAWCEATLGVLPGPGGAHPLMGTHNRLLRIGSERFPRAYLEIVAVDPAARPTREPPLRRWFDLDDPTLQARLRAEGPQLTHFVASVPDAQAAVAALAALGIDRGAVLAASRQTPRGLLQWRITVRDDGQRLFDGVLPTLIEWGADADPSHPGNTLPESGFGLAALTLTHPDAGLLRRAFDALGLAGVDLQAGSAGLCATLSTPGGAVTLASAGRASPPAA